MLQSLEDLSPQERIALAYCAPRGIPLSIFLGRVVGLGESQWTPRDTQAAVLWEIDQNAHCQGCGRPRNECMVAEDDAPEYEVTVTRCWACEAKEAKLKALRDPETAASTSGLYLSVVKVG